MYIHICVWYIIYYDIYVYTPRKYSQYLHKMKNYLTVDRDSDKSGPSTPFRGHPKLTNNEEERLHSILRS